MRLDLRETTMPEPTSANPLKSPSPPAATAVGTAAAPKLRSVIATPDGAALPRARDLPADDAPPAEGQFISFPDSPFQLFQPYPPAGDQPAAIDLLVEGVADGLAYQTLLGVTGSGKTFTMANVIAQMGRPAIVFAPNKTLAAQLYSEFREFFPKNAVEYFVSYYDYYQPEAYVPQRDMFIEKDSAINDHGQHHAVLGTLGPGGGH